jgi:Fe-S-cluster-containing dehydrogenase component
MSYWYPERRPKRQFAAVFDTNKCIACFSKIEMGMQPQCFVNCIGKIRFAGWISKPENARPDNPIDFLVHVKKVALPLFPQFGLEPKWITTHSRRLRSSRDPPSNGRWPSATPRREAWLT